MYQNGREVSGLKEPINNISRMGPNVRVKDEKPNTIYNAGSRAAAEVRKDRLGIMS